jgi:recombination protein RecR
MELSQYFIELRKLFERLPGIGPRQANRFIWALLDFDAESQKKLGQAILDLPMHMQRCSTCFRVFPIKESEKTCSFCLENTRRNKSRIMILEQDSDLLNIEKTKLFDGLYHVIGGPLDPLDKQSIVRERIRALYDRISASQELKTNGEVILALSPTKLGEFTSEYIKKVLEPLKLKITRLGRGISTGIELEYADETTLKQALDNRK